MTEKTKTDAANQLDLSDKTGDASKAGESEAATSAPAPAATADASKSDAKAEAAAAPKEASKPKTLKPSGVIPVFLLDDGPLGPKGAVVRVSKRKLSDLKLKKGTDWAEPTEDQLKIGG